jgi:hypothetical protein
MKQGEQYNYEIVKINHQTHVYSILEVVKGESLGISRAERYKSRLTQEERDAGWSCDAERTAKPVSYKPPAEPGPYKRDRGNSGRAGCPGF